MQVGGFDSPIPDWKVKMRKNEATLYYKGRRFTVWQNLQGEWNYIYESLGEFNTQFKELQQALNIIYETIEEKERFGRSKKSNGKQRGNLVC